MKRNPLLLALVLILALMLTACGCEHTWTEASCLAPKTCSQCGEAEGEALGHSWQEASCETARACTFCGLTEGTALGHSWMEATCELAKTCTACGAAEGEALGHNIGDWTVSGETMERSCQLCGFTEAAELDGEVFLREILPGSWHTWAIVRNGTSEFTPAGNLIRFMMYIQVDADGNIRVDRGNDGRFEGTVSYSGTQTVNGITYVNFLADFGEDGSLSMAWYNSNGENIMILLNNMVVYNARLEEYVEYLQGKWESEDGAMNLTLNADGTFTANLDRDFSGIWQPKPCYKFNEQQYAGVTLCYEIDGVKQVLDLDFYMGETEEEARERLDNRYRDFTAYYDRVNGITLLYYIG